MANEARFEFVLIDQTGNQVRPGGQVPPPQQQLTPAAVKRVEGDAGQNLAEKNRPATVPFPTVPAGVRVTPKADVGEIKFETDPKTGLPKISDADLAKLEGRPVESQQPVVPTQQPVVPTQQPVVPTQQPVVPTLQAPTETPSTPPVQTSPKPPDKPKPPFIPKPPPVAKPKPPFIPKPPPVVKPLPEPPAGVSAADRLRGVLTGAAVAESGRLAGSVGGVGGRILGTAINAASAVGSGAAAIAPVAIPAAGALAAVAAPVIAAKKGVEIGLGMAPGLADVNAQVATAMAHQEASEVFNRIKSGEAFGGSVAEMVGELTEIRRHINDIKVEILPGFLEWAASMLNIAEEGLELAATFSKDNKPLIKFLTKVLTTGIGPATFWGLIGKVAKKFDDDEAAESVSLMTDLRKIEHLFPDGWKKTDELRRSGFDATIPGLTPN